MNVEPTQQPATDDPELAQVLASAGGEVPAADNTTNNAAATGLQFEESTLPGTAAPNDDSVATNDGSAQDAPSDSTAETPESPDATTPSVTVPDFSAPEPSVSTTANGDLEGIKKDALEQLRPLVSRLDLPAEEKFDTLLLIIRSTDDQSLLGAAHEAAKAIEDETKRAQALLDVVKEIDYFSNQHAA